MSFLSVNNVTKRFGSVAAVDSVDFEVPRGAFFALLGPSGCGKTTLLRMIAGFEQPDDGVIAVEGVPMNSVPAHARPTNMVFQSYAIFPHLNVFNNVAYGLRKERLGKNALRARVEAMLATVRLEGLGVRRANELSGGQRQRVALARALVRQPKILLLDEPLGALDKRLREHMQLELRSLQQSLGITFLLVTHDQEEALSMADQVAVMSSGKILQVARPRDLYERPNCREVADFIGQINFFHATVQSIEGNNVTANAGVLGIVTVPRTAFGFAFAVGDDVLLALRPERIALFGGNVAGEIVAVSFLGDRSHFQVKVEGRPEPVFVAVSGAAPSGPIALAWAPDAMMALPFRDS
jgi:ABC-type Fe3+/spermidine/putrescine transport system ATPase subunit